MYIRKLEIKTILKGLKIQHIALTASLIQLKRKLVNQMIGQKKFTKIQYREIK